MTPPIASEATQTIVTIAFGVTATLISTFTVWQGRRAWGRLYGRDSNRTAESDLESQTLEPVELEARSSSTHIFELPAALLVAAAPAVPEEERLLNPLAASAPSTGPTTDTSAPA